MDAKLLVLKRVLEAFGISSDMKGVRDRKLKQKAIYLAQVFGVDLGYRYGWYLMGPYSPSLASDYYALAEAGVDNDDPRELNEATKQQLSGIVGIVSDEFKPAALPREDWFELLASWHYLRNVNRKDEASARAVIQREKSHLAEYVDLAAQRISELVH
jgi:hypothetical protein